MGVRSDRTRGGAGGSGELQTSPPEECSAAETAEALRSSRGATLWGLVDCATGGPHTRC